MAQFEEPKDKDQYINQLDLIWAVKLLDQYLGTRNRQELNESISYRNRLLTMGDIIDNPPQNTFDDFREVRSAKNLEEKKLVYLDFGVYQVYENDDVFHRALENYTENCQFVYSLAHMEEVCRMNSQDYEEKRCESISKLCNNIKALPADECIKVVSEPIAECLKRTCRLIKLNEIAEKDDCAKFEALDDEMSQILNCDKNTLIRNRETLSDFITE